jgi:hypothetical protein
MSARHQPVRPGLDQLQHQARELLRQVGRGVRAAQVDLIEHHPGPVSHSSAKLADVQFALARSGGVPSWPRPALARWVNGTV